MIGKSILLIGSVIINEIGDRIGGNQSKTDNHQEGSEHIETVVVSCLSDHGVDIDEEKEACIFGVVEQGSNGEWSLQWHDSQYDADTYVRSIRNEHEAHVVWDIKDL